MVPEDYSWDNEYGEDGTLVGEGVGSSRGRILVLPDPVDGSWSTWSSWSTCAPDCLHHRRRLCDNPQPLNGGLHCLGRDLDTSNCTGGDCRDAFYDGYGGPIPSRLEERNIIMYSVLIIAIAVFIIVIIVVVFLLRRKGRAQAQEDKKFDKTCDELLSMPPDLTQTVVTTIQNHNVLDSPNNNGSTEKVPAYDTPVHMKSSNTLLSDPGSPCTATETTPMFPPQNVPITPSRPLPRKPSLKSSDSESRPQSVYSEVTNRNSMLSCQLPGNVDIESLVWANVTQNGGRINLPDAGVYITIPEGAVRKGATEEMFVAVCHDDKDKPKLIDSQTQLGPVILVGPPTLSLLKPVVISFQHCASIKHGQWMLSLYGSDTPYDEAPQWMPIAVLGHETINTPVYVQMDYNLCHVMTETISRVTLVGEPVMNGQPTKILRLAAFSPAVPTSVDHNVRVYIVEDILDSLECVLQLERKLGGRLLDTPKQFLFQYGAGNLCLTLDELSQGWRSKLNANYQEIPFQHIWNCTTMGLHCSFTIEHADRSQNSLNCNIHVFQNLLPPNRQVLQIQCNFKDKLSSPPLSLQQQQNQRASIVNSASVVSLEPPQHVFRLPPHIRTALCQVLDPPNTRGNDWRMLAQRLSVDRYINYFATKPSPTEHILDLWEARHREESAITDLMNSLRVMGRMDAAGIIEKHIGGAWL